MHLLRRLITRKRQTSYCSHGQNVFPEISWITTRKDHCDALDESNERLYVRDVTSDSGRRPVCDDAIPNLEIYDTGEA